MHVLTSAELPRPTIELYPAAKGVISYICRVNRGQFVITVPSLAFLELEDPDPFTLPCEEGGDSRTVASLAVGYSHQVLLPLRL